MGTLYFTTMNMVYGTLILLSDGAPSESRVRRFGPMGGGGGGNPFRAPGGMASMGGPMGGAMGGAIGRMNPMQGPRAPGGGGSMTVPATKGQGAPSMFSSSGFGCIRHNIVCPKWCLVEDANGCRSCPCGPGGMSAMAGGSSDGQMGGTVPMTGGSSVAMGGATASSHTLSGGGANGGGSSEGGVSGGGGESSGGGGGGSQTFTGGQYHLSSSNNVYITGGSSTGTHNYVYEKPVKECVATLLCASTCTSGYHLGSTDQQGCKSCACPSNHEISTTKKECSTTAYCMKSCTGGYVMSKTDQYGCPECTCLQVQHTYKPPIEIAVEPPEYSQHTYQPPIVNAVGPPEYIHENSLLCAATSCSSGCNVGYKCGNDGCPTCSCIHPAVVGLTTVTQMYIQRPVTCGRALSCPSSCSVGYKCGTDGCPTCQCLVALSTVTQTRPQYTVQTCSHTLTCAATCTNGYNLYNDGTGGCSKCACKQVVYETRPQYSVQRLQPKYEIVACPSTENCASRCSHGYEVVRHEATCPKCKCKAAPVYVSVTSGTGCKNGCSSSSGYYLSGGSTSGSSSTVQGTTYIIQGSGSSSPIGSYILGTSGGSYTGGSSGGSGSNILSSGGDGGSYTSVGGSTGGSGGSRSYQYNRTYCPPLPPDCSPSCIKYDEPHCRRCQCESSIVRYGREAEKSKI